MKLPLIVIFAFAVSINGWIADKFKHSGMTYTNDKYCNVSYSSERSFDSIKNMADVGVNWVAIVVTQYQKKHNTTEIFPLWNAIKSQDGYYDYVTSKDSDLEAIINKAHELGMKVMLKPHIDIIDDPKYWRGDIGEDFSEQNWSEWFDSYGNMMLNYARLSESNKVEMLSMSCELITASEREQEWRSLINKVRSTYNGLITSSANWGWLNATGGEDTKKKWWDAVDIIGIDAYYNVYSDEVENYHHVMKLYEPVVERIKFLHEKFKKPCIFTEIGFCSGDCKRGSTSSEKMQNLQAIWYQGVMESFLPYQEWFYGFYWWNWVTDAAYGGPDDVCLTPQSKPAQQVLRKYYHSVKPPPKRPEYKPICVCTA
ncbi:beta-galactosidase [Acrasis kona]|uniref:Beta-galactosidase n=1 Tax=Acrasis kona TaxID=1008807 RepID=A0AAW2Z886_9EUKA